ncbi:AraC family transcriptional regulator [Kaistia algarum]|uniref:helix-turn-helix transcriptional regulator n=1 Tax=Kaistia algarum TaxID=2083279 RepID=UPI000CE77966|nr:AraC family transcriptional regulator [Kaistia algarum]MCX5515412.1 AraC family transcriptional regulator [Kaistia algarum]PPE78526.1 AraC family transcriptional regulator [Kaistia algarum]
MNLTKNPVRSYSHAPRPGWLQCGYSVLRAGHLQAVANASLSRGRHAGQDVLFCVAGAGEIDSAGRRFAVKGGQVAWLANEAAHGHRADPESPWELLWLRLDGPAAASVRISIFGENEHVRDAADAERLAAWFQRLFAALERREPTLDLELNQLVASLFVILAGKGGRSGRSAGLPLPLTRVMTAMREDIAATWQAEALEPVGGVSATHLRRLFAQHLNTSPHRWLMHERLLKAQSLLADTDLPVGEIGLRCGFADVFHFSREFKRHLGSSPANWRRAERAF